MTLAPLVTRPRDVSENGARVALLAVRALLDDESRRTTRCRARDASGVNVDPCDPRAVRWDIGGAIERVCGTDTGAMLAATEALFETLCADSYDGSLASFCDRESHADILALLDRALSLRAAEKAGGQ